MSLRAKTMSGAAALAAVVILGGCSTKDESVPLATIAPSPATTSLPVSSPTTQSPLATTGPASTGPASTGPASTGPASTGGGGGSGIVEGDIPLRLPGPALGCATWEEDLANPPADAPPSFRDTTLQRLREGNCPGYS